MTTPLPVLLEQFADALFEAGAKYTDEMWELGYEASDGLCICSNSAIALAKRFSGMVCGYFIEDNPTAIMGKDEDGHDFVVVGGRYLVDAWAKHVSCALDRAVLDLDDLKDLEVAFRFYGDPTRWTLTQF